MSATLTPEQWWEDNSFLLPEGYLQPYDLEVMDKVSFLGFSQQTASKDERIKELGKWGKYLEGSIKNIEGERDQLLEKVEQLEKERVKLAEVIVKDSEFVKIQQKKAIDMKIDRDQSFDLLERFLYWFNNDTSGHENYLFKLEEDINALLSSRENTKP